MSDPEGRRRVELASDNITRHIVEISGDIAEEEETNKRRRERADQTTASENLRSTSAPDEVPPSVRAAMFGKDAVPDRKRRAEDDPDDHRSGVWQNVGDFEDEDNVADLFVDFDDDDATISGGTEASGSGTKRPADDEADDRGRGDDVDIVLPFECNHCNRRFSSRSVMFKHLYHRHDDDGKCAAKRR